MKSDKKNRKQLGTYLTFFMLIMLMIGAVVYAYAINNMKHIEDKNLESYQEESFARIYASLELLLKQSYDSAESSAKKIEMELSQEDLSQIKSDMDNNRMNPDLYDIIYNNIEGRHLNDVDNYRNGLFAMTQDSILEDFNYDRISNMDKKVRNLDMDIKASYNKELEKDAINKILNHSNKLIATEKSNRIKGDISHEKLTEVSYNSLKRVYMREGIEGLKNYQFKAPAYITETGDIFGQKDIVQGIKTYNHKIIIVQEFNLYDQLMALDNSYNSIFESSKNIDDMQEHYHTNMTAIYLLGIIYAAGVVVIMVYFFAIYNYHIDKINDESDNTDT